MKMKNHNDDEENDHDGENELHDDKDVLLSMQISAPLLKVEV